MAKLRSASKPDFHHRVGMMPFPKRCDDERHDRDREEEHDEIAFEPVFGLSAIQNDSRHAKPRATRKSQAINPKVFRLFGQS